MIKKFNVTKLSKNKCLLVIEDDDTLDSKRAMAINCSDTDIIGLMWDIHREYGGRGTLTE